MSFEEKIEQLIDKNVTVNTSDNMDVDGLLVDNDDECLVLETEGLQRIFNLTHVVCVSEDEETEEDEDEDEETEEDEDEDEETEEDEDED